MVCVCVGGGGGGSCHDGPLPLSLPQLVALLSLSVHLLRPVLPACADLLFQMGDKAIPNEGFTPQRIFPVVSAGHRCQALPAPFPFASTPGLPCRKQHALRNAALLGFVAAACCFRAHALQ